MPTQSLLQRHLLGLLTSEPRAILPVPPGYLLPPEMFEDRARPLVPIPERLPTAPLRSALGFRVGPRQVPKTGLEFTLPVGPAVEPFTAPGAPVPFIANLPQHRIRARTIRDLLLMEIAGATPQFRI